VTRDKIFLTESVGGGDDTILLMSVPSPQLMQR
jgi:hypothetical protein